MTPPAPSTQLSQPKKGSTAITNLQMPSTTTTMLLALVSVLLRCTIGVYIFENNLKKYPHFTSPLIEMREMREMFHTYSQTGHFLNSPLQIGQSEFLVYFYQYVQSVGGDVGLRAVLIAIDVWTLLLQLAIFKMVFTVSNKKAPYTNAVFYAILFNPIALFSGNTHANLGGFNDLLWYQIMYESLRATRQPESSTKWDPRIRLTILNILACYFDPRFLMLAPLVLLQFECRWGAASSFPTWKFEFTHGLSPQLIAIFEYILMTFALLIVFMIAVCSTDQWTLIFTIIKVRNPSENIGNFWYVMIEMFKERISFLEELYLLLQFAVSMWLCELPMNVSHMIRCLEQHTQTDDAKSAAALRQKIQRRRERLLMHGYLLITFAKLVLNQYPTLHDANLVFFTMFMNINLVIRYVEGLHVLICGVFYAVANSLFLWITWLERFSGNSNFFYFQTIAFNVFFILIFLQVVNAAEAKRKKYAKELQAQ